jgi:rhodanese-related sulfurtransferase
MKFTSLLFLVLLLPSLAGAQTNPLSILVATDPSNDMAQQGTRVPLSAVLKNGLKREVQLKGTTNLADAMRSSRTGESMVMIALPHVTASAVSHGYQLLAISPASNSFVLIAKNEVKDIAGLKGKRLYLMDQDAQSTYMAKGMLREANFALKDLKDIKYGRARGAAFIALEFGMSDAIIVEKDEGEKWLSAHAAMGHILQATRNVPVGMAISVTNALPDFEREKLLAWLVSPGAAEMGMGSLVAARAEDKAQFVYLASLGILTPAKLDGVTVVDARKLEEMLQKGALAVDTRSQKEYDFAHVPGAVLASYVENSLKDTAFDQSKDDYSAILELPRDKAVIFMCNGAECWKSYKASKVARENGFNKVFWFRGGVPEWKDSQLPVKTALPVVPSLKG